MHGYRDHCIRKPYSSIQFHCPYSIYEPLCPYYKYRQKSEEYPAYHHTLPQNPPPSYIPKAPTLVSSIDSTVILPCINKYTYLWLKNRESFWAYIVYISKKVILGWRYDKGRWMQFQLDLREINNFICP